MDGHSALIAAAEMAAAAGEAELGALMLADAAGACFNAGAAATMANTTARAMKLLPTTPGERAEFVCTMAHGLALVLIGDGEQGADLIRPAFTLIDASAALRQTVRC